MIADWFTNKCMTLVNASGRALKGAESEAPDEALQNVINARFKVWTDQAGNVFFKKRALFAAATPLIDRNGQQVRICGKRVNVNAKFCSKCGAPAPGTTWRCSGCGKLIGSESKNCSYCGKEQNPISRIDISNGSWRKDEEIFAERFDMVNIAPLLSKGLNVFESQRAILLDGGSVTDVLEPGFYEMADLDGDASKSDKNIVMVDAAEFSLPVFVEKIRTRDDIESDLHVVLVLRFNPANAKEFMANIMGNSIYMTGDSMTSALGYDEIAHAILADTDGAARDFCNTKTVAELFKDADARLALEDHIAERLQRNLNAIGLSFIRTKEIEFTSEVFDKLREMSGQIEEKRREIEFMQRADQLANDATRREAMSEYEMEDFMNQLAHEKGIKDDLRVQEIERMKKNWERQQEKDALSHEHDLDDIQQMRQLDRDRADAEFKEEILDLEHKKALERRIAEQNSSLEFMQVEKQIQDIKIEVQKKKSMAEIEVAEGFLKLKEQKKDSDLARKLDLLKAASNADIQALLMAEEDPDKRRDLLALYEQQQQAKMTPELLLAAAAARGNAAAAEALSRLNKDQLEAIERSKNENKEVYERMLQMNERMFNQATEKLAENKNNSNNTTTQIIK